MNDVMRLMVNRDGTAALASDSWPQETMFAEGLLEYGYPWLRRFENTLGQQMVELTLTGAMAFYRLDGKEVTTNRYFATLISVESSDTEVGK